MKRKNLPGGVVLWRGASMIDGEAIAVVATGLRTKSSNVKTGDMVQVWIIPEDTHPAEAMRSGAGRSVCGDCPLRPFLGGGCYVAPMAPGAVWKKYKAGGYPDLEDKVAEAMRTRRVRWGAWGDPALIPDEVIERVTGA